MSDQPSRPSLPEWGRARPPQPPEESGEGFDPSILNERLVWPLGISCSGTVDCPSAALNQTLALLETTRGSYHLVVTASAFTRSRSLWIIWMPRETNQMTLIDEQQEGMVEQALTVIAEHIAAGQPS